jgi:hypothetical protein
MAEETETDTGDKGSTVSTTETQTQTNETLGEAGLKALVEERKARREAEAKVRSLEPLAARAKEIDEANKSEAQKLADELEAAKASSTQAASDHLRLQIALEKAPAGMEPARIAKLAGRLQGADRDALEADAEELFAELGGAVATTAQRKAAAGLKPGLAPDATGSPTLDEQIAAAEKAGNWNESRALKSAQAFANQKTNT